MNKIFKYYRKIKKKHEGGLVANLLYEGVVRLYINKYGRKLMQLFRKKRNPENTVFLVGCYNSGTTILRDILKSHPEIGGMPREGVRFTDAFTDMQNDGWVRMAYHNRMFPPSFYTADECREKLDKDWGFWLKKGEKVLLEKSITHSFRLSFLKKIYPNSKIIIITRDGYCSSEGLMRRAKPKEHASKILGRDYYSPRECAEQWSYINNTILRFSKDRADTLVLRFEDFVNSPAELVRKIFQHIGVSEDAVEGDAEEITVGRRTFKIKNTNIKSRQKFLEKYNSGEFDAIAAATMKDLGYKLVSEERYEANCY